MLKNSRLSLNENNTCNNKTTTCYDIPNTAFKLSIRTGQLQIFDGMNTTELHHHLGCLLHSSVVLELCVTLQFRTCSVNRVLNGRASKYYINKAVVLTAIMIENFNFNKLKSKLLALHPGARRIGTKMRKNRIERTTKATT